MNHPSPSDRVMSAAVPLLGSAETAAALGATLRLRLDTTPVAPGLASGLHAVLKALDIREAVLALDDQEATALLGIVEGFLAQAADFVSRPARSAWDHTDPRILTAQGDSSALVAKVLQRHVVPALGDGLATRMEGSGAWFLDIGTGVAALAIAVCRLWPSVKVLGVDPWQPALTLARAHVARAGLQEQIELRHTPAEALEDSERFDLAWLPTFFIPGAVLEQAITRVHTALRPRGWATLGLYARPGSARMDALADLRTVRQGGSLCTPDEVAILLEHAGFTNVDVHHKPDWHLPIVFVAGRRSPKT